MDLIRKLTLLVGVGLLALTLFAGPAFADVDHALLLAAEETETPAEEAPADEAPAEDAPADEAPAEDDGRVELAEGPRDILALLLLAALIGGGYLALRNARRQLSGDRPQASGEFRWR